MIVRFSKNGGSFLGAGRYYLHDKAESRDTPRHLKPTTDDRVWFTDTRNAFARDPEAALVEMWRTAEDQVWLKQQAGARAGGRPCTDPVKTFTLAWHKDDAPTPEHMLAAADSFLRHMRWQDHQAVLVAHRDTEHLHLHVILNRVHPETGRTIDDFREQRRAGQWRELHEREQGVIRTRQRDAPNDAKARRDRAVDTRIDAVEAARGIAAPKPANDHLPHNVVLLARPGERRLEADDEARQRADSAHWDLLKKEQREARIAWFAQNKALIKATRHAVYDSVRRELAPEWRDFYKEQKAATRAAIGAEGSALTRAFRHAGRGDWTAARSAFAGRDALANAVAQTFTHRKAELKARQTALLRERQDDAIRQLRQARDIEYRDLLDRQQGERAALRADGALPAESAKDSTTRAQALVIQTLTQGAANNNAGPRPEDRAEPAAANSNTGEADRRRANADHRSDYHPLHATTRADAVEAAPAHPFILAEPGALSRGAVPLERTATLLHRIPTESHTYIALVGLALHHDYAGSDAARSLFEQWAARHPSWQHGEARTVWTGIDPDRPNPTGVAMLVAVAKAHDIDAHGLLPEAGREPTAAGDGTPDPSHTFAGPDAQLAGPLKGASDLAAGGIGAVAAYLADQIGEALAPTPPEVREARARAEARREAEKPAPTEDPAAGRARTAEAQVRAAECEREQTRTDDWWSERARDRGRDR